MADGSKVCVGSENIIPDLHNKLKSAFEAKLQQKDWSSEQKDEFRRQFLKIYEETVELSSRENVIVEKPKDAVMFVREEMEPVDKKRAVEVNEMCAKSEDLLTSVIKKRKSYPKRIKECLRKHNDKDLEQLCVFDNKPFQNIDASVGEETPVSIEGCQEYLEKLRTTSDTFTALNKTLPELTEKAKRLQRATETDRRMQENDIHQTLFSNRTTSYNSMLETPTKSHAPDVPSTEQETSFTSQMMKDTLLRGVDRRISPDKT